MCTQMTFTASKPKSTAWLCLLFLAAWTSCQADRESTGPHSATQHSSISDADIAAVAQSAPAFAPLTFREPLTFLWEMLPLGDSVLILNQLYQSDSNLLVHRVGGPATDDFHLVGLGEGPNSVSTITNLRSVAQSLEFFDPNTRKLHRLPFTGGDGYSRSDLETVATAEHLCAQAVLWDGGVFCLPVDVGEVADSRFARYSPAGSLDSTFGAFPPRHAPMSGKVRYTAAGNNQAYQADARVAPNGKRLVLAYKNKDRIEIFGPGGRLLHATDGPDRFDPDFATNETSGGGSLLAPLPDVTRTAFVAVAVNATGIYALYAGGLSDPSEPAAGYRSYATTDLLVYDWDGGLQRSYTLPYAAHELAVTEGGTVYIASDDEDVQIYRSTHPL